MKRIDQIAKKTSALITTVNGIPMKTQIVPCQHHQRKVSLNSVNIVMPKFLKIMIIDNDIAIEGGMYAHVDTLVLNKAEKKNSYGKTHKGKR